ncbi:hypothetical protein [Actinomycetospora chibensis]|uniref:Uncharacterized protein n=1 Tax=Actinomycetospora chibensis TaxID=663606 RepID=A0ABV9REZ5_9PSEU|nr:hypothetical protein [Actinomycetospora chibensis]MDD7925013.1 hypothetical protein [Actinomycetospora chibensis]
MANGELPLHPSNDPRFAGIPSQYPGGQDAYWRDYGVAAVWHGRESTRIELGLSEEEYQQRLRYFDLKKEVNRIVTALETSSGLDGRTISRWLVFEQGFPWRNACTYEDLQRLKDFLTDPGILKLLPSEPVPPRPPSPYFP